MSIQNVNSSTAALNAQLLQQEQSGNSSFDSQDLPQLTSSQVQSLQQSLQNDLQQALSSSAGTGNFQTQLDSSVSNTLSQAGFSQSQIQSVIDKINQGSNGNGTSSTHRHGHGHHSRRALNSLVQTLASNASGQSSSSGSTSTASTSTATSSNPLLSNAVSDTSSTTSGQSLDVTA